MKKILIAITGIFVCVLSANASDQWEQAIQNAIEINQQMAKCTPGETEYGPKIIGLTNKGECHYQYMMEFNGKKSVYQDCYVPMSVLKSYTDEKYNELKRGRISASSSDSINNYCKSNPHTYTVNINK